jgi:type VI protein secretion system component VasF
MSRHAGDRQRDSGIPRGSLSEQEALKALGAKKEHVPLWLIALIVSAAGALAMYIGLHH